MLRDTLKNWISETLLVEEGMVALEHPENFEHGDYSTNIALVLSKEKKENPKKLAEIFVEKLRDNKIDEIEKIEVAGPGFINFFISDSALNKQIKIKPTFKVSEKKKINLEFISANPTGPLTMANGRGGFYGDALANILKEVGHDIVREYYINDAGNQVKLLSESIEAAEGKREDKEEYYKGAYIKDLKGKSGEEAVEFLRLEIIKSLEKAKIKFDVWFSEQKKLRDNKEPEKILKLLEDGGLLEKKEGAVWLDDAVLVKSNGEYTYFLVDIAYHFNKFLERDFDLAIDIWGADHHGYVERMRKGVQAIGVEKEKLKIVIMQLVRLMSGGKEVRMSKRTGEFVTMDELLDNVGPDVARWFFLERAPNTHVNFDLDLAVQKSENNPVFYVQYAHARMCSIIEKVKGLKEENTIMPDFMKVKSVRALVLKIIELEEILEDISKDFGVNRLTAYAYDLATAFSGFYRDIRIISDFAYNKVGLELLLVTRTTLEKTLALLGISAPEKM